MVDTGHGNRVSWIRKVSRIDGDGFLSVLDE